MRAMLIVLALAASGAAAGPDDGPTYTLTVSVSGIWGQSWIRSVQDALGRLEGVQSAKVGEKNTLFVVKVAETKVVLPSTIKAALPSRFTFKSLIVEITGTVTRVTYEHGTVWTLAARGSGQQIQLKANDDLRQLFKDGKTLVTVTGKVTEPEQKEGDKEKPTPIMTLSAAREADKKWPGSRFSCKEWFDAGLDVRPRHGGPLRPAGLVRRTHL